ncbi:hypothetical protein JKP88DRAFT_288558 [Tribonema minus]|uniref:Uncharacterized protein n=1 Tax=Tribonema minus TaxID=303371 RepID=A0A835Z6U9_9STRA|nr:hypothetical protein JKP88DRAFT_288558 [Tribonema minus]
MLKKQQQQQQQQQQQRSIYEYMAHSGGGGGTGSGSRPLINTSAARLGGRAAACLQHAAVSLDLLEASDPAPHMVLPAAIALALQLYSVPKVWALYQRRFTWKITCGSFIFASLSTLLFLGLSVVVTYKTMKLGLTALAAAAKALSGAEALGPAYEPLLLSPRMWSGMITALLVTKAWWAARPFLTAAFAEPPAAHNNANPSAVDSQIREFRTVFWEPMHHKDNAGPLLDFQNGLRAAAAQPPRGHRPPATWRSLVGFKCYVALACAAVAWPVVEVPARYATRDAVLRGCLMGARCVYFGGGAALTPVVFHSCLLVGGALYLAAWSVALTALAAVAAVPCDMTRFSNDDELVCAWRRAHASPELRAMLEACASQPLTRRDGAYAQQQRQRLPPPPGAYRKPRAFWCLFAVCAAFAPYVLLFPAVGARALAFTLDGSGAAAVDVTHAVRIAIATPLWWVFQAVYDNYAIAFAYSCAVTRRLVSPLDLEPPPRGLAWRDWALFLIGKAYRNADGSEYKPFFWVTQPARQ